MCGIIGYVGSGRQPAQEVLLDGLERLEYRGYDSAGIAVANSTLDVHKRSGELSALENSLADREFNGAVGIGHTRWSTHGSPSHENAHPHTDCEGRVAVVHNGIISNADALRAELVEAGHRFESETDTEVVPHLMRVFLDDGAEPEAAFERALDRLEGSYAIAAVVADSDAIYASRRQSPLVVGLGEKERYLASDVPAFIEHTDRVIYLEDGQFVRLTPGNVAVTDGNGSLVDPTVESIDWDPADVGKSGYDHYMLKEIYEQPRAVRQCTRGRVTEMAGSLELSELPASVRSGTDRVQLVGCGTSFYAMQYGASLLCEHGIPAQPFVASEYDADSIPIEPDTLVVAVTQSGETADTLGALRAANRAGATTLAVTNVVGSSAARECDAAVYIRAGPEISVAATKSFASQQVTLAMIASVLAERQSQPFLGALRDLPSRIQHVLDTSSARHVAEEIVDADAYFFVGRRYQYPVALEGALKMKEITYEHAEGFAAGELKHGPLALVTPRTPVVALVTGSEDVVDRTLGTVREVEARGAPVVAVTTSSAPVEPVADYVLEVPETHRHLVPILTNVQLQLLAYWTADLLGRPIDKPRNLAKSVTVE
ncbi:glutamine--fructose-6-phosphate transaminase (isomerizing) [Natrarchaeobius halalkaliphilus]|uniref:Glutamine--fructose-6-phosphate aminotransferase [isomerizing] n=1 Tax=Natrarchaeobius halalkaliphilus TaxID=1679091 RepID=A0A3N6LSG4_9EURY|nr:glutamine--fructose-6-phosphate transaminase (isomerizing) [Natrarchaeobius halalkaliphilus]RQG90214.1 glutamine--fructose-6-phosphate transaminase (isomerizing) [Natrarchaeobius halalkaliphilus]